MYNEINKEKHKLVNYFSCSMSWSLKPAESSATYHSVKQTLDDQQSTFNNALSLQDNSQEPSPLAKSQVSPG
jgi:hypothetical protein